MQALCILNNKNWRDKSIWPNAILARLLSFWPTSQCWQIQEIWPRNIARRELWPSLLAGSLSDHLATLSFLTSAPVSQSLWFITTSACSNTTSTWLITIFSTWATLSKIEQSWSKDDESLLEHIVQGRCIQQESHGPHEEVHAIDTTELAGLRMMLLLISMLAMLGWTTK